MTKIIQASFNGPAGFPTKNCENNKLSNIKMGMPQKFQSSDDSDSFSMGRSIFLNAPTCTSYINSRYNSIRVDNTYKCRDLIEDRNWSTSSVKVGNSKNIRISVTNGKQNDIITSDMYTQKLKNRAIGSGSTNRSSRLFSFAENTRTNIANRNNALSRVRNASCVAPAKVGASKISIY